MVALDTADGRLCEHAKFHPLYVNGNENLRVMMGMGHLLKPLRMENCKNKQPLSRLSGTRSLLGFKQEEARRRRPAPRDSLATTA